MMSQQQRELAHRERDREASFQHTQLGTYLAGAFCLMYLWASSAQGIVDKYHFSARWFYLYGALCLFAYLYMRPFVRRGLGSAGRGYLNFGTLYICWLCSAVFCHLPSLESLGIDIKADVSLGLSIAASSFLVLSVMHGIQQLLFHFKLLTPAPGATQQAVWTCLLLNTLTLAMTCSTYFQLCGNGGAQEGLQDSSFLHQAVCTNWLAPIATREYPNFSAWMLYGERSNDATLSAAAAAAAQQARVASPSPHSSSSSGSSSRSIFDPSFWWGSPPPPPPPPEEVFGLGSFNAIQLAELVAPVSSADSGGSVISPVFTMWITLVALYIVNVLADHVAANNMSARHISELRRDLVPDPDIALLAQLSTAAGITLRENAHQWAAAQQQRHREARKSLGAYPRAPGVERSACASKKHIGIKRSKSLESHRPARQPWSPRYTMERAMVNILETTSSFSFKAAALLEGKPFTWQDSMLHPGTTGAAAGAAAAGGNGQDSRPRGRNQQQHSRHARQGARGRRNSRSRQQQQQQLQDVSDSVGSMSPVAAAIGSSTSALRQSGPQAGALDGGFPGAGSSRTKPSAAPSMHNEPSFKPGLPAITAAAAAAAGGGSSSHSSGSSGRAKGIRHQRSRSLSSIQSGDGGPMLDAEGDMLSDLQSPQQQQQQQEQQQQQQRQQQLEELSVPSVPPVTSPFARVAHNGPGGFTRAGFGSAISLSFGSPPSSHRWTHQQQQQRMLQQAQQQQQQQQQQQPTYSAADGSNAGGSPTSAATPASSAAGPAASEPVLPAADAAVQPPFLDMVPWYSGTSADLFKTMFDLLISVKLFLGRFDMRTMQAATAASMAEHPAHSTPREGDGFTFENYADRQELWFDFIADTGDGGNPTYAVARALAAPELVVPVSNSMASAITGLGMNNETQSATQQQQQQQQAGMLCKQQQQAGKGAGVHHSSSKDGSSRIEVGHPQGHHRVSNSSSSKRVSSSSSGKRVSSSSSVMEEAEHSAAYHEGLLELPRGEVLLIGGDLAYPNPSRETFEQRLFVPFQEAMPPPPHYHPGRLVVHKPDLPPSFGPPAPPTRLGGLGLPAGHSPRASRGASVAALRDYGGPNAFAIPGNHDWIDGLETFIQQIQHKGWLGGWLLPQEKSYFALRLPAGWWVFGLDLALVGDIDMCQYRYFANVIEQRLGPQDNVIIITHEPTWLLEWFWASSSSSNLRQLVRGHLRGRARVHMAGDLHFYMRHSYSSGNRSELPRQDAASAAAAAAGMKQQQQQADPHASVSGHQAGTSAVQAGTQKGLQEAALHEAALQDAAQQGQTQVRRLSSSSDGSSSSSSGVDSCPESGPESATAAAAAAARCRGDSKQGGSRDPTAAAAAAAQGGRDGSSSSSSSTAVGSPVEKACKNLPRLQLSRSSFEGLAEVSPATKPCNCSAAAGVSGQLPHGVAAHAAAGTAVQHQQYTQAKYKQQYGHHNGMQYGHQQQQYGQQYGHHHQQYAGSPSRFGDTSSSPAGLAAGLQQQQQQQQQHSFLDPEHLIVNGMGGAFMHPTHVFSYSRFAVLDDEAATATAAIYSSADPRRNLQSSSSVWHNEALSWHCPVSPSGSTDIWDFQSPLATAGPTVAAAAAAAASANGHAPAAANSGVQQQQQQQQQHQAGVPEGGSGGAGVPGLYKCAALFPSAATSLKLGSNNLHLFRFKNSRFDVIGGAIYFLSIVSILPRCNAGLALLASTSLWDFAAVFTQEFLACWYALFMESYLSLFMACALFLLIFGFAKTGGVGAVSGERQEQRQVQAQRARNQQQQRQGGVSATAGSGSAPPAAAGAAGAAVKGSTGGLKRPKQRSPVVGPLVKLRTGGISNQLLVAMLHTGTHLTLAIVLLLLLELGVEICIKYESLGQDGMGSMYRWFEAYQDQHFPDPMGLRAMAHKWSLGLYPGVIKAAMTLYDIPEAIAVVRNAVCAAPTTAAGFASLTRLQAWAYYGGMLAYYWLLATPAMGFVFGLYLYISVCWFHVHYDEAFSALRIANFKGLTRLHITPEGDLEIYTLGMDRVPTSWREDHRWYGPAGAGSRRMPAHVAAYPSRWVPAEEPDLSGTLSGELEAAGVAFEHRQRGGSVDGEAAAAAAAAASPSTGLRLVDYVKVPRIRSL